MEFEWDPEKDRANQKKHGISFRDAIEMWESDHIEVENIAKSKGGESRNATLGVVDGKVVVVIWTQRGRIRRIISVRRARPNEEKIFKQKL